MLAKMAILTAGELAKLVKDRMEMFYMLISLFVYLSIYLILSNLIYSNLIYLIDLSKPNQINISNLI